MEWEELGNNNIKNDILEKDTNLKNSFVYPHVILRKLLVISKTNFKLSEKILYLERQVYLLIIQYFAVYICHSSIQIITTFSINLKNFIFFLVIRLERNLLNLMNIIWLKIKHLRSNQKAWRNLSKLNKLKKINVYLLCHQLREGKLQKGLMSWAKSYTIELLTSIVLESVWNGMNIYYSIITIISINFKSHIIINTILSLKK